MITEHSVSFKIQCPSMLPRSLNAFFSHLGVFLNFGKTIDHRKIPKIKLHRKFVKYSTTTRPRRRSMLLYHRRCLWRPLHEYTYRSQTKKFTQQEKPLSFHKIVLIGRSMLRHKIQPPAEKFRGANSRQNPSLTLLLQFNFVDAKKQFPINFVNQVSFKISFTLD